MPLFVRDSKNKNYRDLFFNPKKTSSARVLLAPDEVTCLFFKLVLLAAAAKITEASTSFSVHEGVPSGATSLCSAHSRGCLEGYLTNGTRSWDNSMPQFSRVVYAASSSPSITSYTQQIECISLEKMALILINALNSSPPASESKETAAVVSGIWRGYQTSFTATNIPSNKASAIEAADLALATGCQSLSGENLKIAVIVGIVIGSLVALGCLCVATLLLGQICKQRTIERRRDTDNHSTLTVS